MIFLIKAFIIMKMVGVIVFLLISLLRNITRQWFTELLENNFLLVCSCLNQKILIGPWFVITTEMLLFKIILMVSPLKFLGLTTKNV